MLREYPSLQTIDGRAGDEGKDSFIGRFAQATHVFQIKYFDRIGPNQRRQIKESLEVASKQKPDKWTILLPTEFSKYDWKWFDELRKTYPSIQLDVWQSPQIEALVLDPKNDGLKDVFPELFPISTLLDWATKRVQKASMNATNQTASSLIYLQTFSRSNVAKHALHESLATLLGSGPLSGREAKLANMSDDTGCRYWQQNPNLR